MAVKAPLDDMTALRELEQRFKLEILRLAAEFREDEERLTNQYIDSESTSIAEILKAARRRPGQPRPLSEICPQGLVANLVTHAQQLAEEFARTALICVRHLIDPKLQGPFLADARLVRRWHWHSPNALGLQVRAGFFDDYAEPPEELSVARRTLTLGSYIFDPDRAVTQRDVSLIQLGKWLVHKRGSFVGDESKEGLAVLEWINQVLESLAVILQPLYSSDPKFTQDPRRVARHEFIAANRDINPFALLIVLERDAAAAKSGRSQRKPLPKYLPQPTSKVATTPARAYADGPTGRGWHSVAGEIGLLHVIPGEPLHTKVVLGQSLDWWGIPATYESLRKELAQAGTDSVFVFYELLSLAASSKGSTTVALDDLATVTWDRPRSTAERLERRQTVWRWLALFEHTFVIGARRGVYQERDTKKRVDTISADPLFRVVGREYPINAQQEMDMSEPPVEVEIVAGRWLDQYRGNRRVLTDFGNIRRIGAIPPGKPSGEWARCIGLALNQRWREMASYAEVDRPEKGGSPSVRYPKSLTRRGLLSFFPPKRYKLETVLGSTNPSRACDYWVEAIALLRRHGVIGHYAELTKLQKPRKGWQDEWLDQPLDIRPTKDGAEATAEIAARASKAKASRTVRTGGPQ